MKNYTITIRATITKTYTIDAESREEAEATAHDLFDVRCEDGIDEDYEQETVFIA